MSKEHAEGLSERPEIHWISREAFQFIVIMLALNMGATAFAVHGGHWWLVALLILTGSHLMHGALIGFHEASHGLLRKQRWFNELDGVLIGVLSLVSFSLYRVLHQWHHVHLSTAKDEEFWPFTNPGTSRGLRVMTAIGELTIGMVVSPLILFRCFVRRNSSIRNKRVRKRIWIEYALTAAFWTTVLVLVNHFGVWKYFLCVHFAPAFIAANLQSWRKYVEHLGMTGATINGSTRSIVANGLMGRLVSFTLLHEPFHGVHHRHASLPHCELPSRASVLEPKAPGELPPFRSYAHAVIDVLRNLGNPRIGAQWVEPKQFCEEQSGQKQFATSA